MLCIFKILLNCICLGWWSLCLCHLPILSAVFMHSHLEAHWVSCGSIDGEAGLNLLKALFSEYAILWCTYFYIFKFIYLSIEAN